MSNKFSFDDPDDAIRVLAARLTTTAIQSQVADCTERISAVDIFADRDSPAADVSAMDGYGVRMSALQSSDDIPVLAESVPGSPPPVMPEHGAIRIFTGGLVPPGCDAVIKREDTQENASTIRLTDIAKHTKLGDHIRRAGENARKASRVVPSGCLLTAAVRATMANFGAGAADVYAPVRVTVITTGDEVGVFDQIAPEPWQLRNSNQVAITSLLSKHAWIDVQEPTHCKDDRETLTKSLTRHLQQSDAIILTGGVSMGDYDHVPDVVRDFGGEIIFHGLPIRPGKPILGAATHDGKLILGLPGNPVSATIGCQRFAVPLLARISGRQEWLSANPCVRLESPGDKTIPLRWFRLVRMVRDGEAQPVETQGSGDLVSLGRSSGFVEIPKNTSGPGPWPYHAW